MKTQKPGDAEACAQAFIGQVQTLLHGLRQGAKGVCACCGRSEATLASAAARLGVGPSVIRRRLSAPANLTLRSLSDTLWAFGWEPRLTLRRRAGWPRAAHAVRLAEASLAGDELLRHRAALLRAGLGPDDPLAAALDAALARWSTPS